MTAVPTSPYRGLSAFEDSELDALFFFGRERECEIVVANLIASRLTVLYGPSGVGKSSLLRAAVARRLRELPEEPLVVVFSHWSEDPAAALAAAVSRAAWLEPGPSLLEALEQAQAGRDVYLVLDQLEEYFLYHANDRGPGTFAEALPAVVTSLLRVNVLVSLREDSLAKLDRFTGRIPGVFANTLRLDRLDLEAARAAVTRPVERFAELTGEPVTIEPALVERVLGEVGTGRIASALGGLGAIEGDSPAARVEAPYLQLVMQRLWEEERTAGSWALRAETLRRLGGSPQIVREHLESAMGELSSADQDVASRIFNHLVTPSGTKIAHEITDLADFGGVPLSMLRPVLTALTDRRILRSLDEGGGERYEIFHDVLAQPVLAWRTRHESERELELQKDASDRRHRRLLAIIGVGAVLLAVMAAVTVYAFAQRSEARTQAREARAHQLEALSAATLELDPERSLLLARQAAGLAPSEQAEQALRSALVTSRVRAEIPAGRPLLGAAWRGRDVVSASVDGTLLVSDPATGRALETTETGEPAVRASFADDGTALLTGTDGLVRVVRPNGDSAAIPGVEAALRADVSPDGTRAAVIGEDAVRLVAVATGDVLQTFAHRGALSSAVSRNNELVVTGSADGTIDLWVARTGTLLRTLPDTAGQATAVALSPGGTFVAGASTDALARIWRVGRGGVIATVGGGAAALTDVGFSSDGIHLVTSSRDGSVRVSKTDTGATLLVLMGHDDWVTSAEFSGPVGSAVVTASLDGTARVWDALYQPVLARLASVPATVTDLAFDSDGRLRVTTQRGRTHVLDAETGVELGVEPSSVAPRRVSGPNGSSATIRGSKVILRSGDRTIVLDGHRDRITSVAFAPDGSLLATASRDHDVRLWDVGSGANVGRLQHNSEVRDVEFSTDGRWLVTAAGRAVLWDPRSGSLVVRLQGHEGAVTAVSFDPTGRVVLTGGTDGTVRLYACDVCTGLRGLVALADARLAATGAELTPEELAQGIR